MDIKTYYTAPPDHIFEEIKREAIKIWQSYDDTYGYATDKINRIKDVGNVKDNYAYIIAMFDTQNQRQLLANLAKGSISLDAAQLVADVMTMGIE